jgi:hypothetical protein
MEKPSPRRSDAPPSLSALGPRFVQFALLTALALSLPACDTPAQSEEPTACTPGHARCVERAVEVCRIDGSGYVEVADCAASGGTCIDSRCVPYIFQDASETAAPDGEDAAALPDTAQDKIAPQDLVTPSDAGPTDAGPDLPDEVTDASPPQDVVTDHAAEPMPEVTEPTPDVAEPTPDVAEPTPDVAEPTPDVAEPTPDVAEPAPDVAEPEPEIVIPPDDPPGAFAFHKIKNIWFTGDFVDVIWTADGARAFVVTDAGLLLRYDPMTEALDEVTLPAGFRALRLGLSALEGLIYVAGRHDGGDETEARLYHMQPDSEAMEELTFMRLADHEWMALAFARDGKSLVVGGRKPSSAGSVLWLLGQPYDAVADSVSISGWPNLDDVLWGDPAVFGTAQVVTSAGVNSGDSQSWLPESGVLVDNGWGNGFGNPGRGARRPGGQVIVLAAKTTMKVYVYEGGAWTYKSVTGGSSAHTSVVWNPTGTRMLVLGRAMGTDLKGTIVEYRPTGAGLEPGVWVDQSIADFDETPWLATMSRGYLHHAAFRPGSACAEGLVVSADNGPTWDPTFGMLIRFVDSGDPDCPEIMP